MVVLTFYRNFAWITNFISLVGCFFTVQAGQWSFLVVVLWAKLCSNLALGVYVHLFHNDQYTFFQNVGMSLIRLYALTFLLDMSVWLFASILTVKFLL